MTDISVEGVLETPAAEEIALYFFDDGTNGDNVAGDGTYTSTIDGSKLTTNGQYKSTVCFSNPFGTAIETDIGISYTQPPDDGSWTSPGMQRYSGNFHRQGFLYFNVEGGGQNLVRVSSIGLTPSSLSLQSGEQQPLTVTVRPDNATNKRVDWFSSDSSIAAVDENGVVYAVTSGNATITAITADGNRQANCDITVTQAPVVMPPATPEPLYPINDTIMEEGDFTLNASPFTASDGSVLTGSQWQIEVNNQVEFDETLAWSGNVCIVNVNFSQLDDIPVDPVTGKKTLNARWRLRYLYQDKNDEAAATDWSGWGQFKIERTEDPEPNVTYFDVSFNSNGGTTVPAQKVESGETANQPLDPIKNGHTFAGWYKESNYVNKWNFYTDTVTRDITLYARWLEDRNPDPPITEVTTLGGGGGCDAGFGMSLLILAVLALKRRGNA